ncbi:MAG: quinone oxidoreductase [Hyphomonadaceae bacterium BRH_c29]|nr:MAG: quinone oxidoreductase [Hyphomonadaceae bacterium BRH_c29]
MATRENIVVTGATGQLGRLVLTELQKVAPSARLIGLVRDPTKAQNLAAAGVELRTASYDDPASLRAGFAGADKLLLISGSEVGQRAAQHRNMIDAAKAAGVGFIVYTSLLHAPRYGMALAEEHLATEALLRESGIVHTLLRNGWYSENFTFSAARDIQAGKYFGAAGDGRFSTASRQDFAEAAAVVLAGGHEGKVLELAGDTSLTLADYAAQLSAIATKPVEYVNLPEAAYRDALIGAGLPAPFAAVLADTHAKAASGALQDDSNTLSKLIGRSTTLIADTIKTQLA